MMCDFAYDKVAAGNRIRERRVMLELTQEKAAERLDLSLRTVTEIERGAVGMSIETLLKICRVLKMTPNDILLPQAGRQENEETALVRMLSNVSDRERAVAVSILRAYLRSI